MSRLALAATIALSTVAFPASLDAAKPVAPVKIMNAEAAQIDIAIKGVYAVISGPAGKARDWDAMRAMFTPDARLTAITPKGIRGMTVEQYIEKSGPVLTQHGFTERELARRVEIYGNIAHVWSSYGGTTTDNSFHVRGINSFQLARGADGRWLVQSIFWQPETPELPLPSNMEKK